VIGTYAGRVKLLEAGRQDNGTNLVNGNLRLLVKINGPGLTGTRTLFALLFVQEQTMIRVNGIGGRYGLSIKDINGLFGG